MDTFQDIYGYPIIQMSDDLNIRKLKFEGSPARQVTSSNANRTMKTDAISFLIYPACPFKEN